VRVRVPDGSPYAGDPRNILRQLDRLAEHDFSHINIGQEAEYFYFRDGSSTDGLDQAHGVKRCPGDAKSDADWKEKRVQRLFNPIDNDGEWIRYRALIGSSVTTSRAPSAAY
jgi:glutamine synthetase